ncbi:PLP-dependent aminotransferase family protein [Marisediminicola sp. LYQ134]|uniref:MocR-like transcription factor YczR n=1 Tax=Marisediminicola sp. LYQ134 TaxID=3391061 RepID=UPI003983C8DA
MATGAVTVSARALDALLTQWRSTAPAYQALADRIRLLVVDGRIPVGSRLPAERDLAARLGVSRTTITATYTALRESGHLESVRGSGSVARMPTHAPAPIEGASSGFLDFSKATMPAIPRLADAAVRAARDLPAYLGESGFDPVGLPRVRQAIADRFAARGLPTDADQIMVTIGAQHAIALLSRVILGRGDRALVESPSYPHAFDALRGAGARLVPVGVTSDAGWDVDGLEQALNRSSPALAYVMPDFHNPTGRVMPADQRERMLALASRNGTVVVADETMAELAIDEVDQPLPLAAYGPAVLVGSLGKTVWGGVRIGWIRAEPDLIDRLVRARSAGDLGTPVLEQLIAAEMLGEYDEILAVRRDHLAAGRTRLERALGDAFPEWTVPHVTGGLTTWVGLGAAVSSQLTIAARSEGLLLASGPRFGIDGAFERFLRVPFCYSEGETDAAVAALSRAWTGLGRHPFPQRDALLADVV